MIVGPARRTLRPFAPRDDRVFRSAACAIKSSAGPVVGDAGDVTQLLPRWLGRQWLLAMPFVLAGLIAAVTFFVLHFSAGQATRLSLWICCPSLIVVTVEWRRRRRQARRELAVQGR